MGTFACESQKTSTGPTILSQAVPAVGQLWSSDDDDDDDGTRQSNDDDDDDDDDDGTPGQSHDDDDGDDDDGTEFMQFQSYPSNSPTPSASKTDVAASWPQT